jgi:hypothetical protein
MSFRKIFVIPRCIDCIFFKPFIPSLVLLPGNCTLHGNLEDARKEFNCGIQGKDYKPCLLSLIKKEVNINECAGSIKYCEAT